jgi:hypothetical protein
MNEKRSISTLISIEEAGNYGTSELLNDGTLDNLSQTHVQAPSVCENDVSTLVSSFCGTPEKPAAVDCGAPLPFSTVHVETAPMLLPMMFPCKTTAKLSYELVGAKVLGIVSDAG